jgi:colanic acid biosynthesis glycosyl transferase WcaI
LKSLRILIHGINFSPEFVGVGKYTGEMAEYLVSSGHEVSVVTAPPYYPDWIISKSFKNFWSKETLFNGNLSIYRCPLWVPNKASGLNRILHLLSFAISSFPVMLIQIFNRPDVVIVIEPPLFCAPQSWFVAKLSGAKSWLHIQDFEVDAAFDLGLLRGNKFRRLALFFEKLLMSRFDRVSTISNRMLDRLLSKGISKQKTYFFPNWMDFESFELKRNQLSSGKLPDYDFRKELDIPPGVVVALYSGNMGRKQGLEILAKAAKLLRDDPVVFVFCGNGEGRSALEDRCADLKKTRFLDLQPIDTFHELLLMADIHLLPQRADAADLVMPSKLTGMLASGRPVVATASQDTELAEVVKYAGLVVEPEQLQAFADAILKLALDNALRMDLGNAAYVYAKNNLDKDMILSNFERELHALVDGTRH